MYDCLAPKTGEGIRPGESFEVIQVVYRSENIFLRLADDKGWIFQSHPTVGLSNHLIDQSISDLSTPLGVLSPVLSDQGNIPRRATRIHLSEGFLSKLGCLHSS
jgi:hypothetical protein